MRTDAKCILLVEDESVIALSEARALKSNGYVVYTAHNGKTALAAFHRHPRIDMVLMDIDLGSGMDGTQAAELILQEHDIPLVFLSSHTEKELVDKTRNITNYGYVLKDAGDTVLLASIDMAFKLHESNRRLKESEARYRLLADNSQDVIWTIDMELRETYVSPSVYQFSGWTPEEMMDMSIHEYILPEYFDSMMELLANELSLPPQERSKSKTLQYKQYRKDGSVMDVETHFTWILDAEGNPTGIQGSSRDITSRKSMEATLDESENRYRVIIENLNLLVYSLNEEGAITYISPNVTEFGFQQEEIVGRNMLQFFYPDDHESIIEGFLRGKKGDEYPQTMRLIKKTGEIVWMLETGHTVRDATGEFKQHVGFLLDISSAKKAEEALQKSEQQYRLLAENSTDVIWTMDLNERLTYMSPSIIKLAGWTPEEILQMRMEEYLVPDDVSFIRGVIAWELAKPASDRVPSVTVEIRQIAKDGSILNIESIVSWIYDANGDIIGIQGSNRNINERRRAEEALARLLKEKESLLRELQHRVKNSLAIIGGLISLESNQLIDQNSREVFTSIRNRIQSMAILYDLLFQSNEIREVRLDSYLAKIGRIILDSYAGSKSIKIVELSLDEMIIDVKRAVSVGIIMNELLTNTIKHACMEGEENRIRLMLKHNDENNAIIDVVNENSEFPEDFNPLKTKGMGLKIVRMLTEQLNGKFDCRNHNGALFRVVFPVRSIN